jgi:hypothetical protein
MSRAPRAHSGHRTHRRRGSGRSQRQPGGEVLIATVPRLDGCLDDLPCNWHGECSRCGETIHLAGGVMTAGYGLPDPERLARFIVGDPAVCADCRGST